MSSISCGHRVIPDLKDLPTPLVYDVKQQSGDRLTISISDVDPASRSKRAINSDC